MLNQTGDFTSSAVPMQWHEEFVCPDCKKYIVGSLAVVLALAREHTCPISTSAAHITTSEVPSWSFAIGSNVIGADPNANN